MFLLGWKTTLKPLFFDVEKLKFLCFLTKTYVYKATFKNVSVWWKWETWIWFKIFSMMLDTLLHQKTSFRRPSELPDFRAWLIFCTKTFQCCADNCKKIGQENFSILIFIKNIITGTLGSSGKHHLSFLNSKFLHKN